MVSDVFIKRFENRLTILIGGHGSGKSEFAIMWAKRLIESNHAPVVLIDLDTIKPLFRTQEAKTALEKLGIRVIISSVRHSDIPSLSSGQLGGTHNDNWVVVDVGGDAIGARVLASIKHNISHADFNLFYVLNASRPYNSDVPHTIKELQRIESISGLKVNGLISNTHMLDETTAEIIENGITIAREISTTLGIVFIGVMVEDTIAAEIQIPPDLELFTIQRMLNPYWLREYLE
jgi:energy-coupling factor transporter ATP-binding protein EcfA2